MGMYRTPIEIVYGQMQTQMEGDILRAVQSYGINVDKEELIRALQYDRDQYNKGYADGKAEGVTHGMWKKYHDHFTKRHIGWICSNCSAVSYDISNGDTTFCPHCGSLMDLDEDDERREGK